MLILNKACNLQLWDKCKNSKTNRNKILVCEMEVCLLLGIVMGLKVFSLNRAIKLWIIICRNNFIRSFWWKEELNQSSNLIFKKKDKEVEEVRQSFNKHLSIMKLVMLFQSAYQNIKNNLPRVVLARKIMKIWIIMG